MRRQALTIALTDDDQDDQEIFAEALSEVNSEVKLLSFQDGEQLMHFLRKPPAQLPDLVFLDLNMPIKNGKSCLTEIRANKEIKHLPIAIYSTSSSRNHILETQELGADWYISKPSSFTGVKKVLDKMITLLLSKDVHAKDEYFIQY